MLEIYECSRIHERVGCTHYHESESWIKIANKSRLHDYLWLCIIIKRLEKYDGSSFSFY